MPIKIYNSLSRKIEPLVPLEDNKLKIYVCGITPYDASHLGHAFVFVFFDALIRFLKFQGYKTTYIQNVTDIDDDILKRAAVEKIDWKTLGGKWTKNLLADFEFLNIQKPDVMPKASEVIDSIIQIIKSLEAKKFTYEVDGNVYFSVSSFKKYGALSRLPREEMIKISAISGADPKDPRKQDPLDFVLWQPRQTRFGKDEPAWPSPWGAGRPGWHIECSAMSWQFLGERIDIHGGGSDLVFPHHESEIAQSESFTGKSPFVKYWLHCGMVMYENEKMSKSIGNLIFIKDLKKKYSANAIRWYLLSHHYRGPWEYVEKDLEEAQKTVDYIEKKIMQQEEVVVSNEFIELLSDDFNSPKALEILKKTNNPTKQYAMWSLLGLTKQYSP